MVILVSSLLGCERGRLIVRRGRKGIEGPRLQESNKKKNSFPIHSRLFVCTFVCSYMFTERKEIKNKLSALRRMHSSILPFIRFDIFKKFWVSFKTRIRRTQLNAKGLRDSKITRKICSFYILETRKKEEKIMEHETQSQSSS